ncbi:MAG: putative transmembrane [Beijerinckiaceae bacterium]|nr:MAG: putative transmembrane [Beijerinckiaceae bacterium]
MAADDMASPEIRHALYEDAMAILMATLFIAFGVALYAKAALVTGGTAGLALLAHHASGLGFWLVFSVVNLPFYALAIHRMGWRFAVRTFVAVTLVSVFARFMPSWVELGHLDPVFATIIGGGLMGTGLLMLFRHRTALGGINILAMFLQDRWGIRAGYVQLGLDLAILAGALFVLKPESLLLSGLGALVVNMILAINHRPGRYLGMS